MENFLIMVEQLAPSQEVAIDGERPQFFNTKLKIGIMPKFRLQTIKNFHSKTNLPSSRAIMLICLQNIPLVQV